ncbi:MAG: hypothetical protein ACRDPT_04080 [Streptomycetales bacterium]
MTRWPSRATAVGSIVGLMAVGATLVSGCGKEPQAISDRAARTLGTRVSLVHSTLNQHEWSRARNQLAELHQLVERERTRGHISSRRADRILAAIARLDSDLPRTELRKPARARGQPAADDKRDKRDEHSKRGKQSTHGKQEHHRAAHHGNEGHGSDGEEGDDD